MPRMTGEMKNEVIEESPIVETIENSDDRESRLYELGCLLVPIIAVESLASTIETLIRGTIVSAGGQITHSEEPRSTTLAYPIRKTIDNKNVRFKEAHFVFCRFRISPEKVIELDQVFRFSPILLRHLLTELPVIQTEESHHRLPEPVPSSIESSKKVEEPLPLMRTMSDADMDEEIEGLLKYVS